MNAKRNARRGLLAVIVLAASLLDVHLLVREAHAIVGRPLTPVSYAGVARRTVRTPAVGVRPAPVARARYW